MKKIILSVLLLFSLSTTSYAKSDRQKIYHVPPTNIAKYIENTEGQKRVVMIYTSWCPYCRKKMPGLIDLENTKEGSIIPISVDENYSDFTGFVKRYKQAPFRFILNKGRETELADALEKYGVRPWQGYPTIVFINEANKVVGQGNFSIDQMATFLFK